MIQEVVGQLPPESTQQAVGYPSLFLLVALGALVPVVPTGALVSSAAVVAFHQTDPFALLVVFGVASSAAFLGDICLYWLGQRGVRSRNGSKWLQAISDRAAPERLAQAQQKLDEHGSVVLVLSRLVAGRADSRDAGVPAGPDANTPVRPRGCRRPVWRGRRRIS